MTKNVDANELYQKAEEQIWLNGLYPMTPTKEFPPLLLIEQNPKAYLEDTRQALNFDQVPCAPLG